MKSWILLIFTGLVFFSCNKDNPEKQLEKDIDMIEKYLSDNNLEAEKTAQGVYYIIETPGGERKPKITESVRANYRGYFLDGVEFDSGQNATFPLYGVIEGWQIGIPKFGIGGKGTLLIPSKYAYGSSNRPGRANAILIFDIELLDIL